MPRLKVVEYYVQIGGQEAMRFLEIGKILEGVANKQHATYIGIKCKTETNGNIDRAR